MSNRIEELDLEGQDVKPDITEEREMVDSSSDWNMGSERQLLFMTEVNTKVVGKHYTQMM